jgi:AbiV family abortive infection protein
LSRIEQPIPEANFREGLEKSIKNGDSLVSVSKFLFELEKYQYSVYYSYMGMEEYGKALLFLDDILSGKSFV